MMPFEQVEVLRAACCVAGADGETSEEELRLLNRLADESGVGDASLKAMLERATTDCKFCDEQFKILKTDPEETMAILLEIAISDGALGEKEKDSLRQFAIRLAVPEDVFTELVSRTVALIDKNRNG